MHLMSDSFFLLSAVECIYSNPLCICRTSTKWSTFTTFRAASLSPCCVSASRPSAVRRTVKWSSKTSGFHLRLLPWAYHVLSGRMERWCYCVFVQGALWGDHAETGSERPDLTTQVGLARSERRERQPAVRQEALHRSGYENRELPVSLMSSLHQTSGALFWVSWSQRKVSSHF